MLNAGNIVDELHALCQQHPASHHPLFDFPCQRGLAAQIDYFFKSDSALNLLFFDLVAMGLVGSLPETRAEIAQNLWDEIGQGSTEITHVNFAQGFTEAAEYRFAGQSFCPFVRVAGAGRV